MTKKKQYERSRISEETATNMARSFLSENRRTDKAPPKVASPLGQRIKRQMFQDTDGKNPFEGIPGKLLRDLNRKLKEHNEKKKGQEI